MKQESAFTPVQRTVKHPGDYEYIWRNGEWIAVKIERREPELVQG